MSIVVLHGFTGSGATMRGLADRIDVDDDVDVVTPDLAGHGAAAVLPSAHDYSVEAMARSVLDAAAGPDGSVDLVGYSMGGRVAFTAACLAPERVRSLTLVGASAGLADPDARAERVVADEELARLIEADLTAFVERWMANPLFATQVRLGAEFLAASRAQRLANDPAGLALSLRQAGTGRMTPLHDRFDRCTMPVSLVAGMDDPKFRAIAADLADGLPDAAVHFVGGAGHAVHLEQPAVVAQIVEATRARAGHR